MLSKNQFLAISRFCSSGIIGTNDYTQDFFDAFVNILNKCAINKNDDRKTEIFKSFIIYGGMTNTIKETHNRFCNKEISDTLFYKQVDDIEITLLAKMLYFDSGTKYKDFLKWQIDVILINHKINVKDEYLKWKLSTGESSQTIYDRISNIDF